MSLSDCAGHGELQKQHFAALFPVTGWVQPLRTVSRSSDYGQQSFGRVLDQRDVRRGRGCVCRAHPSHGRDGPLCAPRAHQSAHHELTDTTSPARCALRVDPMMMSIDSCRTGWQTRWAASASSLSRTAKVRAVFAAIHAPKACSPCAPSAQSATAQ